MFISPMLGQVTQFLVKRNTKEKSKNENTLNTPDNK